MHLKIISPLSLAETFMEKRGILCNIIKFILYNIHFYLLSISIFSRTPQNVSCAFSLKIFMATLLSRCHYLSFNGEEVETYRG